MVIPPAEAVRAAIELLETAGRVIESFFSARKSADDHVTQFNLTKESIKLWEYLVEAHHVRSTDDRVSSAFKAIQASLLEYEKEVTKWHRRVGSDFTNDADQSTEVTALDIQQTSTEGNVPGEGGKPRRKRIAPMNRAKYICSGDRKISRCAARYKSHEATLFAQIIALSATFGHIDVPNIPPAPGGVPALIRFIALAKKRVESNYNITIVEGVDRSKYQVSKTIIDPNTAFTKMFELALLRGDLLLKEKNESPQGLQSYTNCIVVKRSGDDLKESLDLARLFAEDPADKFSRGFFAEPPDGAMLRCCAVFLKNSECDLYFRAPEGCSLQTLRQLLLTSNRSRLSASKADRVKLSIRIATSVLVVHTLGLVHKRILPETVLVAQKQMYSAANPRKVGFPYLAAFQGARSDVGMSMKKAEVDAYRLRGIYFHPRDQTDSEYREERYTMEDDIYSLGVCLFEIGLWRSLLVWNEEARDYVYDDSFVPLSDQNVWVGDTQRERAQAKLELFVAEVKKRIPAVLGQEFVEVVISCLTVGYDSNPLRKAYNTFRDEDADDPVAWKYLELVLSKLRSIHESYEK